MWYASPVADLGALLLVKGGVAAHTYASALDQLAQQVEQRQAEPRQTLPTNLKIFGPAMRQARIQRHLSCSPAACGADIFDTAVSECPACAGLLLRLRKVDSGPLAEPEQRGGEGEVEAICLPLYFSAVELALEPLSIQQFQ